MIQSTTDLGPRPSARPRLSQPEEMKTDAYLYGIECLNGHDAWALFEACAFGDMQRVQVLLAHDPRLVNAQYWYQFPLHMAVRGGHAEIVDLLLQRGADPGQSRYTYDSWDKLLRGAVERGHARVASILQRAMHARFRYSPDFDALKTAIISRDAARLEEVVREQPGLVEMSDALGNNALHWSVITRQLALIQRFVQLGTPIDAPRADGQTPVLLAANGAMDYWYRDTRGRSHPSLRNTSVMVGSLLALGAGYTLSVAAAIGDQEQVEALLRIDPELAGKLDSARISPLTYAAGSGHLHLVSLLLQHGADPSTPEDAAPQGRALFEACRINHQEIAELLLKHGADPNAGVDSSGCCLTIAAVYHGARAKPLQKLLRQHGAQTPPYAMSTRELKQAVRSGDPVIHHEEFLGCILQTHSRELLDLCLDADPTAPNRLAFESVVTHPGAPTLIRKLLARGLDPNLTDWLGKTYLHACAEQGARSAAAVLLDAGADIDAREVEFQETPLCAAIRAYDEADPKQAERQRGMVEFLLKRGATTHWPDDDPSATPLAVASRRGLNTLVDLLKRHGAA